MSILSAIARGVGYFADMHYLDLHELKIQDLRPVGIEVVNVFATVSSHGTNETLNRTFDTNDLSSDLVEESLTHEWRKTIGEKVVIGSSCAPIVAYGDLSGVQDYDRQQIELTLKALGNLALVESVEDKELPGYCDLCNKTHAFQSGYSVFEYM